MYFLLLANHVFNQLTYRERVHDFLFCGMSRYQSVGVHLYSCQYCLAIHTSVHVSLLLAHDDQTIFNLWKHRKPHQRNKKNI